MANSTIFNLNSSTTVVPTSSHRIPIDNGTTTAPATMSQIAGFIASAATIAGTWIRTFTYYVDSILGDDGNAGTGPNIAFRTIGAALLVFASGQSLGLACGSMWRELLDVSTISNSFVGSYGSGMLPCLSASDVAANASWSLDTGNTYKISVTTGAATPYQSLYKNGTAITRAASLAACRSTAGTMFPSAESGSITIYYHDANNANVITDLTLAMTYTTRECGYKDNSDGTCEVQGIWCDTNHSADGSILLYGIARDCIATRGNKHNMLIHRGAFIFGGLAAYQYWDAGTANLVEIYDTAPSVTPSAHCDITIDGLKIIGNGVGSVTGNGIYAHVGSGGYPNVTIRNTYFENLNFAISAEQSVLNLLITNCSGTGLTNACVAICPYTMEDCAFLECSGRCIELTNSQLIGDTVNLIRCRFHSNGIAGFTSSIFCNKALAAINIIECIVTNSAYYAINVDNGGAAVGTSIYMKNNICPNDYWFAGWTADLRQMEGTTYLGNTASQVSLDGNSLGTAGIRLLGYEGGQTTGNALAANATINAHTSATYFITKGSAAANILPAPTATIDDGIIIRVISTTAFAHTITATNLLKTGTVADDVATFSIFAGASLTLVARAGVWNVAASNAIVFT